MFAHFPDAATPFLRLLVTYTYSDRRSTVPGHFFTRPRPSLCVLQLVRCSTSWSHFDTTASGPPLVPSLVRLHMRGAHPSIPMHILLVILASCKKLEQLEFVDVRNEATGSDSQSISDSLESNLLPCSPWISPLAPPSVVKSSQRSLTPHPRTRSESRFMPLALMPSTTQRLPRYSSCAESATTARSTAHMPHSECNWTTENGICSLKTLTKKSTRTICIGLQVPRVLDPCG